MPLKILLVYNDSSIVGMMTEGLTSLGAEVRSAGDALEAADAISQEQFEGIFVDPTMPIAEGCQLARRIRQSPLNRSTPILIITVRNDQFAMAQVFEAAGTFFLQDPIDSGSLARLLSRTRGILPEVRRQKRMPLATEVTHRALSLEITGASSDLSEEGILFQGDGSLRMGQKVPLTFSLPDQKPAMVVEGVVARVDDRQRVLVCFTRIAGEDRQRIRDFLAAKPVPSA